MLYAPTNFYNLTSKIFDVVTTPLEIFSIVVEKQLTPISEQCKTLKDSFKK